MPLICSYVAHPVGAGADRADNIQRAIRWHAYLVGAYEDRVLSMPWLPYVLSLPETAACRARGMRDDMVGLALCSELILVGGHLSPGMREELTYARRSGLRVVNLLELGAEPPERR